MVLSSSVNLFVNILVAVSLLLIQTAECRELIIDVTRPVRTLCNCTVQGRHLRSDDRGYVCRIADLQFQTGCCKELSQRYSCLGCNLTSQCCNSYEYCVSCCLDPSRTSPEVALKTKIAKQLTAGEVQPKYFLLTGTSSTVFEYCSDRCRHNSASVVHENAYISDEHHCFVPPEQDQEEGIERNDADFGDLTIVIARQSQSCDSACNERQKKCKQSALSALNQCAVLKKYLNCQEVCIASTIIHQPSEVVKTAPRHMNPGSCMYSTLKVPFLCQGSHPHIRRLCPCSADLVSSTGKSSVEKEVNDEGEWLD